MIQPEREAELVERIARRVVELMGNEQRREPCDPMSSKEAAKLLGYKRKEDFWNAVRRIGIPHTRLSPRKIIFREADITAALASRTIGKRRAP